MTEANYSAKTIILKSFGLGLIFAAVMVVLSGLIVGFLLWKKVDRVATAGGSSAQELVEQVKLGWHQSPKKVEQTSTFLILGLDNVPGRSSGALLTDSIIVASLNYQTGKANLLSFPRDIYSDYYQSRINALYSYGLEQTPDQPDSLIKLWLSQTAGISIDYSLVISPQELETLIDTLGGVEIDVPESFVDDEFPVEVTNGSSQPQYKTVEFSAGRQTMDAIRALEYIRSRHSQDETGTDQNRGLRQQLVMQAIFGKLQNRELLMNEEILTKLFQLYQEQFSSSLPLADLVALAKAFWPVRSNFAISSHQLTIESIDQPGAIYHPPTWQTGGQWLYYIKDQVEFARQVKEALYGENND